MNNASLKDPIIRGSTDVTAAAGCAASSGKALTHDMDRSPIKGLGLKGGLAVLLTTMGASAAGCAVAADTMLSVVDDYVDGK